MAKGCRSRWLMTIVMGLCALIVIGTRVTPAQAQRQGRFVEDVVTSGSGFNQDRRHGDPIEWTHSLSSADVAAATSGGVIVDAYDVDYPSSNEYDRLWINGNDYGLLEGQNNQWGATEKSIRISHLQPGSNAFRVDPDEDPDPPAWVLQIRRSTLYLYADEDFDIDASPNRRSVDTFDETTYEIQIDWIGVWGNPVDLSVSGLPAGATATFSPATVSSDGGTSEMTVTLENVAPGRYPLTITGRGTADYEDEDGSRSVTRRTRVDLVVDGDDDGDDEDQGSAQLTVVPDRIEVELGETVTSKITSDFIGNCQGPVILTVDASPFVRDAGGGNQFDQIDEPERIMVRLAQTELMPDDNDATLEMRVGRDMEPGEYDVTLVGNGCQLENEPVRVTLVVKAARLKITKRQSQSTLRPNMVQIYTIRVENVGDSPATNVVVTDTLSSDLTYVSDTTENAVHSENNGRHQWEFARPLRPGASFAFNINARVGAFIRAGGSISNQARVTADQVPKPVVSNTVTAVMGFEAVEPDGLRVTKRALKRDARIGGILTYRVEVENISSAGPIFDIELTDRIPTGFKIPDGKTLRDGALFDNPQFRGRTYTWQLGNLGPGDRTVVTYQAVVGTNAAAGRNENIAEARGTDGGGNRVRGRDSALVMLGAGDLEILGQITVATYMDVNGNQRLDESDEPAAGIDVILVPPGLRQATTDDQGGETIFTDLKSGQYLVAVDELRLPEDLFVHERSSQMVRLMEGESADVSFLLFRDPGLGKLIVRPFFDANGNGVLDDKEELVPNFDAALEDTVRSTDNSEQAIFTRLEPGSYELKITASGKSLTQTVDVKGGLNKVDIPVSVSRLKINIRKSNN